MHHRIKGWSSISQVQMPVLAAFLDELCDLWTIFHAIKHRYRDTLFVPIRWYEVTSGAQTSTWHIVDAQLTFIIIFIILLAYEAGFAPDFKLFELGYKASVYNVGDLGSIPGSGNSLRRKWQPTPVLLPRKSHGWRTRLSDFTFTFHFQSWV